MPKQTSKPRRPPRPLSPSARALATLLEDEEKASRLTAIHRTMLWRWSTGRGSPDRDRAFLLEELTNGEVSAKTWATPEASKPARVARTRRKEAA